MPAAPLALLPDWILAALVWVVFLMVAGFVVSVFLALWLREDAGRHGMGVLTWPIILVVAGTLVPFIGAVAVLVVYYLARMEHPGTAAPPGPPGPSAPPPPPAAPPVTSCRTCGAPLSARAAYCANCGSSV